MQDYIDLAEKNGVILKDNGMCQFCGSNTKRGVHECLEIFNFGFQDINYSDIKNHIFKFLIVDAHTLQHPEIHGRWNNHFHLSRLHLIFKYNIEWSYKLSPKLSDYLNKYKIGKHDEYLIPPKVLERGVITATDILEKPKEASQTKDLVRQWAFSVYNSWSNYHNIVDSISKGFLNLK